jgi:adenylate cyclase
VVEAVAPPKPFSLKLLPALRRVKRSLILQSLVIIALATAISFLIGRSPIIQQAEQWTRDIRMVEGPKPLAPDPNIVVVAITEKVLDQFPYRSPVDRAYLAQLLKTLAAKHVRAIGLDVLFDKPTEPVKDAALRDTIRHLPMPLEISFVDDPRLVDPAGLAYVRDFVPPEHRGMANVPTDADGTVRHIYPGEMGTDGHYVPGLARSILAHLGINTPSTEQTLIYRRHTVRDQQPFAEYPANIVQFLPEAWFKGKIVMIGADLALTDRHRSPFSIVEGDIDGQMPGIVIHAHGLAQLLEKQHLTPVPMSWAVIITLVLATLDAIVGRIPMPLWARFGGAAVIMVLYWVAAMEAYLTGLLVLPMIVPTLAIALSAWISDTMVGRQARQQRNMIQGAMSRYVSPKVVSELIRDPSKLSLTGARREMSFLFTDVAGFTTLAEGVGSEKLTQLLNEYLTGLCAVIQERDGTICRFIGDAVFALWNAPSDQADHHRRIVDCAIAIDAYAERFAAEQKLLGVFFGHTRIGIHAGEAVVGNFGSPQRMEYTALGDAVNLSSRLESVNKYFGTRICVSDSIVDKVPDVPFRPIARVIVKGKTIPIPIFEPLSPEQIESGFAERYNAAYALMQAEDPVAREAFETLLQDFPKDGPVAFHAERLRAGENGSLVEMHEK